MTSKLYIDLETYSDRDLKKHSPYTYSESPVFEIMMAAYALDDDPVQVVFGADIALIPGLWDPTVQKVAHNAPFERICLSTTARQMLEIDPHEYLPPEQWKDTMALAAEWGYPQGLDALAKWLGGEQKDSAGTALINFFCKPKRDGSRNTAATHPEKWAQFVAYCAQDVETLRSVEQTLPDWPNQAEFDAWCADQRINDTGIAVDLEMVEAAMEAAAANKEVQEDEMRSITGCSPSSNVQMMGYFRIAGSPLPNLQKETIEGALAAAEPGTEVHRVLELRQELALVAAKKYSAAQDRTSQYDHRLRGALRFFGAHTGRWSGSGVQLQNLPGQTLWGKGEIDDDDHAQFDLVTRQAVDDLKLGMPVDANTLKALVRSMFVGPFNVVDYSAIEARVVSWLAGEQWALDAFAAGRDIYVETAERMSTPSNPLTRKEGKVAVLALGYNGGVTSLRAMGAEGTDDQLKPLVYQWREANENIVSLWHRMDAAFRTGGPVGEFLTVEKDGADRYIRLPSGRAIGYHDCRSRWVEKWGKRVQEMHFADPKPPSTRRMPTYGGRLVENVTQAVARDILAEALTRLVKDGKKVVAHVHDEILVEGPASEYGRVKQLMTVQPTWAPGLPLDAEGFPTARYRKG